MQMKDDPKRTGEHETDNADRKAIKLNQEDNGYELERAKSILFDLNLRIVATPRA